MQGARGEPSERDSDLWNLGLLQDSTDSPAGIDSACDYCLPNKGIHITW